MASTCIAPVTFTAVCRGAVESKRTVRPVARATGVKLSSRVSTAAFSKSAISRVVSRRASSLVVRAEEETVTEAPKAAPAAPVDQGEVVADTEFAISKVSFGTIALSVGLSFLIYGFGSFFQFLPGASISSLLLIYGFPISLIGAALQYAKLDPVPCISYAKAVALRETQATAIQTQVREDVTRYRYGDEQHLDEALKRVFRIGQAGGIPRKKTPLLTAIREELMDDKYTLILCFDDSCPFEEFESRQPKLEAFFGPGVKAPLTQLEDGVELALISTGETEKTDEEDEWIVLPPLQPGLPPRRVRKSSVPTGF